MPDRLSIVISKVAFDPLDGSSIIGANFAVGSIFGIWPGTMLGSTGRDQAAAAYAVYGPQTLLVWSRPKQGERVVKKPTTFECEQLTDASVCVTALGSDLTTEEYVLSPDGCSWKLRRSNITIAPTKNIFAPANLRATAGNKVPVLVNHCKPSWQRPLGMLQHTTWLEFGHCSLDSSALSLGVLRRSTTSWSPRGSPGTSRCGTQAAW